MSEAQRAAAAIPRPYGVRNTNSVSNNISKGNEESCMKIVKLITIATLVTLITMPAFGRQITIASWKIDNLRREVGLRGGRQSDDIERLARYAAQLDADIIAFQGVECQTAAKHIFPSDLYNFYFPVTDHYEQAGFAVRDGISVNQTSSFSGLAAGGRSSRGTDITVTVDGQKIRMLSVDLHDGCRDDDIDSEFVYCKILKYQLGILKRWIHWQSVPFVIMGSFNRMFDFHDDNSWKEIDSEGILLRVTKGRKSECLYVRRDSQYIDHILFSKKASDWIVRDSFREIVYSEKGGYLNRVSSHCPISVVIDIPSP